MDKNNASYKSIYAFIKINRYTWTVEKILEEYKKKKQGFYISYTANHVIENNELAIKVLLGEVK